VATLKQTYRDNPRLKRVGVPVNWTPELVEEYKKCKEDYIYFAKYVTIISLDKGIVPFNMYDFQKDMIKTFDENRFVIVKCPRQVGKALDIETPILTNNGFIKLKEITVGDIIYGPDGKPTKVTFITEIMENRPCYLVTFSNGDTIIADEEHLWTVNSQNWNTKNKTLTTKEIIPFLEHSNRPYIDFTESINFDEKILEIDPYTLGVWLGDGSASDGRFTCHVDDLNFYKNKFNIKSTYIDKRNQNVSLNNIEGLFHKLRLLGVLKNKHIPKEYLFSSKEQRIELIRGLMDTDGSVRKQNGGCEFYQKNEKLIDDFRYLLSSLGIKSTKLNKIVDGRIYYSVNFTTEISVFNLPRKKILQKCKNHPKNKRLYFDSIESIDSVPVRCLQVDNEDHLFLAGNTLIPTHNTTTAVTYLLWTILFKSAQNIAILANKGKTANDILGKLQLAYESIPIWMQQGVVEWNKGRIELENNSVIIANSTSSSAARSGAYNIVFLDEFAFVPSNIAYDFLTSVYPVITSGTKTKILMVSTPNGMNLFYKLWNDAVNKRNDYVPFEIHWSQVPGRDEEWKEQTIRNTSEHQFRQEFGTEFLGSTNTLISGLKLQQLSYKEPIAEHDNLKIYEYPIKGDDDNKKDHLYGIWVDVSEGKNLDSSAFSVVDISTTPYRQVATYRDSTVSPVLFPTLIYNAAKLYNDAYILVEINNTPQVADILHQDLEYENLFKVFTGNKKPQQLSAGFARGVQLGVKMSPQVKRIGCSNLKTLIEGNKLEIVDFDTISELTTFVANKNSFAAESDANDDMVMGLVMFAWVTTQKYFREIVNHDLRKQIQLENMNQIDEITPPAPVLDDGLNNSFDVWDNDVWEKSDNEEIYSNYFREIQR
jgi:hypothetical protein